MSAMKTHLMLIQKIDENTNLAGLSLIAALKITMNFSIHCKCIEDADFEDHGFILQIHLEWPISGAISTCRCLESEK